jgi:acyl carrier protein
MTPHSLETVTSIARSTLNLPHRQLNERTPLQDAGIDSLLAVDLVFAIQDHYGIAISPADVAAVRSLTDLAMCVDRLVAEQEARP